MISRLKNTIAVCFASALLAMPMILQAQRPGIDGNGTINFETDARGNALVAGVSLSEQYAEWGVHISAVNNRNSHPDQAIIFDSSNPSGGDTDLGTPHQSFGGPGIGEGGTATEGVNNQALGNILILAENMDDNDGDGIVDQPDDEAAGGKLIFKFDHLVDITELVLVDIDKNERGAIIVATGGDKTGMEIPLKGLGDNSVVRFTPTDWTGIDRFEIHFPGSGAVASLSFELAQN